MDFIKWKLIHYFSHYLLINPRSLQFFDKYFRFFVSTYQSIDRIKPFIDVITCL